MVIHAINYVYSVPVKTLWQVYPQENLAEAAQTLAEKWIRENKKRSVAADLKLVNAKESAALASAFLSQPFLLAQYQFLWSRKKYVSALIFGTLALLRPILKYLLKK